MFSPFYPLICPSWTNWILSCHWIILPSLAAVVKFIFPIFGLGNIIITSWAQSVGRADSVIVWWLLSCALLWYRILISMCISTSFLSPRSELFHLLSQSVMPNLKGKKWRKSLLKYSIACRLEFYFCCPITKLLHQVLTMPACNFSRFGVSWAISWLKLS